MIDATAYFILVTVSLAPAQVTEPPVASDEETVPAALERAGEALLDRRSRLALRALEPVERLEPDNPWLWFYRGWAHEQLGNAHAALRAYDRARDIMIDVGASDQALAELLEEHRRRTQRRVFSFSAVIGLAYDTNVTYGGSQISTFDLITGEDDAKFASYFRFEYAPLLNERETLALSARLGHSWHASVEDFNHQDYAASIYYERRLDDHWYYGLRYDYDFTLLGNESFLSSHALSPRLTYRWPTQQKAWFGMDTSSRMA